MRFGSVCSGIEAASVAWEPLGWSAAWLSEIEPFPCAVLAHHWPAVTNLGDMTLIKQRIRNHEIEAPEVFTGGTPCQAFSVAGKRGSLDDARGNLTLEFVRIADAIDDVRQQRNEPETIIVWENVPGVLNTKDNAFGCFLAALAGEDCELQPSGKKWTNAGCVYGPKRAIAWRIIDAQYFGVAQRRKRVFVIASARKGFDPAAVLFESEGVRRDSAPSREKGQSFTHDITGSLRASGVGVGRIGEQSGQDPVIAATYQNVSHCLNAGGMGRNDYETESFVIHGTQDPIVSEGRAHALGRNNGAENAVLAFSAKDYGGDVSQDLTPTLRAGNSNNSHANSGNWMAVLPIQNATRGKSQNGLGIGDEESPQYTLDGASQHGVLAFNPNQEGMGLTGIATPIGASTGGGNQGCVLNEMAVRRLTPIECERLQGFPDGHTDAPYRGKPAADGPRYKAIGNSWAVPCARWIGERIQQHLNAMEEAA